MAVISFNFESYYLGNNTVVTMILPDKPRDMDPKEFYDSKKKYRVLWLLHGSFDDGTGWLRRTMVEVYAREKNLIVVMPNALNSNYVNWDDFGTGYRMGDFLTEELMPIVQNWFPASPRKEDNFIAGDSMGGGGALKYILSHSDKFAAAAMLSSAPRNPAEMDWDTPDPNNRMSVHSPRMQNTLKNVGGREGWMKSVENGWDRIMERHEEGTLPKMLFACGANDGGYDNYKKFEATCKEKGMDIEFFELPGYGHEWRFWDKALEKSLDFFGIQEKGFIAF